LNDLKELQTRIEYTFKDESLLVNALTHRSYTSEAGKSYNTNNERLEFIGDAYLDAIIGWKLFTIMTEEQEGVLSKVRANVVREESLATVAGNIEIGKYIILGKGEEQGGGREKASILADAIEALIGAIYIDGGYEEAKRVTLDLFAENIRLAVMGKLYKDYKSELQERIQSVYKSEPIIYTIISEKGPDHDKSFTAQVEAMGRVLGTGMGKSKKEAEQKAAEDVIIKGEI
jgi:ribonuclease-3